MADYFANPRGDFTWGRSPEFYSQRLQDDGPRVFQKTQSSVEFLSWSRDAKDGVVSRTIDSFDSLSSSLVDRDCDYQENRNILYVIRQKNTWDNLSVTSDLLLDILKSHQIFFPFLDCIHAFGFRMNDDDEVWEGCHKSYAWDDQHPRELLAYEIAYVYRYMTKNGRTQGSRWSLRQTAVYQKTNLKTGCSVWILIQPSDAVLARFKTICLDRSLNPGAQQHTIPHVMFYNAALEGWKEFIAYLRPSLQELDEKACFARVGRKVVGDFEISFSDAQNLQKIRQKLLRSVSVLDEVVGIINVFREHLFDLQGNIDDVSALPFALQSLDELAKSARYHKNVFRRSLEYSTGTAMLLRQIPEYQLIEELNHNSRALNDSMLALRNITAATQTESAHMLQLARQNREDTLLIKILTRVTIFYLPATLVATIFSSNLITSKPVDQESPSEKLVVTSQFWIYVLVTIAVTIPTMVVPVVMEKRNNQTRLL